ncbi:hypothetical protein Tco_0846380 [Tanacetum coccineum]
MSGTIPPIPPPFGASSGNPGSPNINRVDTMPCKTAKEMWNDLILAHEGPSDTKDTKIAALRLKFNAFKSLEGEKVNGTFTRLKCLLNDLENNGVTIPQAEDSDSDVEEDQRTNNEFMADLNVEYHDRALLANQKRFYKRSGRDYPSHKNSTPSYPSSNNSFNKSKPYTPSFNQTSSQNSGNHQKDYKGKYKGLKAETVVLTKRIDDMTKGKSEKRQKDKEKSEKGLLDESFDWDDKSVSSYDEGSTKIKAFMAIAEDEPLVGKADARSGQWVDITMKKVHRLLSMTDGESGKVKGYHRPNKESESALIFPYLLYTLCLHSEDDTERLKTSVLNQNVEEEKDAKFVAMEKVAEEQSLEIPTVEQLLDEADKLNKVLKDQTMHDSEEIVDIHEGSDSDLQSMPDDDLRFVSGFHTADFDNTHENEVSNSDHIFQDDNASAERLSLPDHMDHICEEVSSLHSRLGDMESSIVQQVLAEFKSSLPALVTDSLKEQLPSLLLDALKDTLPQLLKDSIKSSVSKSISEELPHVEDQCTKSLMPSTNWRVRDLFYFRRS